MCVLTTEDEISLFFVLHVVPKVTSFKNIPALYFPYSDISLISSHSLSRVINIVKARKVEILLKGVYGAFSNQKHISGYLINIWYANLN